MLYFFKDTVLVYSKETKKIFIPNELKRIIFKKKNGIKTKNLLEVNQSLKETWNTKYQVETKRDKLKIVNGIEGYYVKIIEIKQSSIGELRDITELYINDDIKLPINHYEILDLKDNLNLNGLILEIKSYDNDTPEMYYTYTLENYNLNKQNKFLIKEMI